MAGPRPRVGQNHSFTLGTNNNKQAHLGTAYQDLAKELASEKLKVVGGYTLGRVIGEGTYGTVHIATHRSTGIRCAIKKVPKAFSPHLTREIHHHRHLHHPNIVHLHEILATETHIWLVTELCSGGELFDYLVERGRILEGEARRLFGELTIAVGWMHKKGVVHRDLKLENVLLDGELRVKLGDLGFVREQLKGKLMDTFCGTTGYASPEMLSGKKYLGEETDIWSLGIILYTLLCGGLPFDDDDERVMKDLILKGEYEEPEWLSEGARSLIRGMLQQDPTKRLSIDGILTHPWFKQIIVDVMPDTAAEGSIPSHTPNPQLISSTGESLFPENQFPPGPSMHHLPAFSPSTSAGPSPLTTKPEHPLASFPPIPESEPSEHSIDYFDSDHGKDGTDSTTPTTAEDEDLGHVDSAEDMHRTHSGEYSQTEKTLELAHQNTSQTTIKRVGTDSPTLSAIVKSRVAVKTALAGQTEVDEEALTDGEASNGLGPLMTPTTEDYTQPLPVAQHSRTPSRTKRRSVSSSLSLERRQSHHSATGLASSHLPEDYLALLNTPHPEPFSTPSEKHLLGLLSDLGFNTGQMVHSVTNDACDSSAAAWWLLRHKQAERGETDAVIVAQNAAAARRRERAAAYAREEKRRRERERDSSYNSKYSGVSLDEATHSILIPPRSPSSMELGPPVLSHPKVIVSTPEPMHSHLLSVTPPLQPQITLVEPPSPRPTKSADSSPATQAPPLSPLPKIDMKPSSVESSPGKDRPVKGRSPSMSMLQRAIPAMLGGAWKVDDRAVSDEPSSEKSPTSPTKLHKPMPIPKIKAPIPIPMGMSRSESDQSLLTIPKSSPSILKRDTSTESKSPLASPVALNQPEAGPSRGRAPAAAATAVSATNVSQATSSPTPSSESPSTIRPRASKRDSFWHTFRHMFNEEKRRRKREGEDESAPLPLHAEVKVGPAVVLSRGPAARAPHVNRIAQPAFNRRTSADGRPGYSRRSSSVNSRRSSFNSAHLPESSGSHDALPTLRRRTSTRSHGSQTPTSDRETHIRSRPDSLHELHLHTSSRRSSQSIRSPSMQSDASGRFRFSNPPASPLHNYHRRATAGSNSKRVRHIRVIPESHIQIVRTSSVASSIRSNNSSRASSRDRSHGRDRDDSDYDTGREDSSVRSRRISDISSLAQQIHRKRSPLTLPSYPGFGHAHSHNYGHGHSHGHAHGHGHGHGHGDSHRRHSLKPPVVKAPLRDVFQKQDDEWVSDEDDDDNIKYSGGLGQAGQHRNQQTSKFNMKWDTRYAGTAFPGTGTGASGADHGLSSSGRRSRRGSAQHGKAASRSRKGSSEEDGSDSRGSNATSKKPSGVNVDSHSSSGGRDREEKAVGLGIGEMPLPSSSGGAGVGSGGGAPATRRRGLPSTVPTTAPVIEEEEEEE